MIQCKVTIINKLGLHARAAAKFVATASAYGCSIQAGREGQMVDAKSIMSVMMLAASKGTEIDLVFDGADEIKAQRAMLELIDNKFDEAE